MPPPGLVALYITICCVLFILSKMLISFLLYKRWAARARKKRIVVDSESGGKLVMFRAIMPDEDNNSSSNSNKKKSSLLSLLLGLSAKDVIGAGGYGTVYRLLLDADDKQQQKTTGFAVKRLNRGSAEMERGFERELDAMGDIKHRNIVPLCGYYAATHFNLLIYELMPNGSLDQALHHQHGLGLDLGWASRFRIALGVARGLSYLHHDCIPHVIHRDIKSSNVLLDRRMEPRLSDFGLATLVSPGASHVTTLVAGTFGYVAPEYFDIGRATTRGDVYSYGVLLLELLTGKRPTDEAFFLDDNGGGNAGRRLVTWVRETREEKREEHAVDHALLLHQQQQVVEEIRFVFSVADKCLDSDPAKRPTMAQVVKMLEEQEQANHHQQTTSSTTIQ